MRSDQLDLHQTAQIHRIVGTKPLIEASAGDAQHRKTSARRRRRPSAVFIRRSVKLVPHSEVQSEGWMHLPVVFEEDGPVILMRPGKLSRMVQEAVPLRILRVVDI